MNGTKLRKTEGNIMMNEKVMKKGASGIGFAFAVLLAGVSVVLTSLTSMF